MRFNSTTRVSVFFSFFAIYVLVGCVEEKQSMAPASVAITEESEDKESELSSGPDSQPSPDLEQNDPFLNRISPKIFLAALLDLKTLRDQGATRYVESPVLEKFGITPQDCDRVLFLSGVYPRYRVIDKKSKPPEYEEVEKSVSWAVCFDLKAVSPGKGLLEHLGTADESITLKLL